MQPSTASCPLLEEAKALLEAVRFAIDMRFFPCNFRTDSAILADALSQLQPPSDVDWRAAVEIFDLYMVIT